MFHVEVELQQLKDRAKVLRSAIAKREEFIDQLGRDAAEAQKLHGAALSDDKRILGEWEAIISQQEKDIAAMKASGTTEAAPADANPS